MKQPRRFAKTITIFWGEELQYQWSFFIPKDHAPNATRDTVARWKKQYFFRRWPSVYRRVTVIHNQKTSCFNQEGVV